MNLKKYVCDNWVTFLYTWIIVNQLHLKKKPSAKTIIIFIFQFRKLPKITWLVR